MSECIAAIITGSLQANQAISVIRVSGDQSVELVNSLFSRNISNSDSHKVWYGWIVDGSLSVDEVLVSVFLAPKTYTRENIVEISCHGGLISARKVLELLLRNGCRLANKGEFTQRALYNGRIDFDQVQTVQQILSAKTDIAHSLAINKLAKKISNEVSELENDLLNIIANIEVNIDYPEYDDVVDLTTTKLLEPITALTKKVSQIIKRAVMQQQLTNGINLAIVGRTNVGKSSLMNALLEQDKAIVTDIEGTTRDVVEGEIILDGILIKIMDTAGIRETSDVVEQIGIAKSYELIEDADLVLIVIDQSKALTDNDYELLKITEDKKRIIVLSKNDLPAKVKIENAVNINHNDISMLRAAIVNSFDLNTLLEKTLDLNEFQILKLTEVKNSLENAQLACYEAMPVDIIVIDLQQAWADLKSVMQKEVTSDLLDVLFSEFCLGK